MASAQDTLWYKNAIIYQVHVRTFFDSNGDGIGDFRGLTQKLDYLQELGITALWLMPFFPSPLRDDGYDIADYRSVHPSYGTVDDFKKFLTSAHERGIRVIIEMVLNHTSDQHAWFQESRSSKDNPRRDWYVWSDTDTRYRGARIIFLDTEMSNWAWDPISKSYYWHRFFSHQPDLNYDNPAVREEMWDVMKSWGLTAFAWTLCPISLNGKGPLARTCPRPTPLLKSCAESSTNIFPEGCSWPKPINGPPIFGSTLAKAMSFTWPSIFRSCRECSWG